MTAFQSAPERRIVCWRTVAKLGSGLAAGQLSRQTPQCKSRTTVDLCGRSWLSGFAALVIVVFLADCAGLPRLRAVPESSTERATVFGISNARFFPDTQAAAMVREAFSAREREQRALGLTPGTEMSTANFLAISGGSEDGAFGSGVLIGWTEAGTRPEFKIVTGISTGALIAPFAFLGSNYDPELRDVYTSIRRTNVFELRSWLNIPFSDSMADTTPLFRMISKYVNQDMLNAIAREYAKGRLLLIGTTNLDVQRPVFWNIGAIAASGNPAALDLFRRILLASSSVPVFFPPVMIEVEADGHRYAEMHVDGGAVAQMFLYPPTVSRLVDMRSGIHARDRRAYLIRNSRLDPEWASVDRRLLTIATRAISTMIQYSGQNDIARIQATCERDGVDFNLAYIGADFKATRKGNFDPDYMGALFDYGYRQARAGYPWYKGHPILSEPVSVPSADQASPDSLKRDVINRELLVRRPEHVKGLERGNGSVSSKLANRPAGSRPRTNGGARSGTAQKPRQFSQDARPRAGFSGVNGRSAPKFGSKGSPEYSLPAIARAGGTQTPEPVSGGIRPPRRVWGLIRRT